MTSTTHLISVPLEPLDAPAASKLRAILDEMCATDATLRVQAKGIDQIVVDGVSEGHLERVVWRLKREHDVAFKIGHPQVAYRETITSSIEQEHALRHADSAELASVKLRLSPLPRGAGIILENRCPANALPKALRLVVEAGVRSVCAAGIVAGYPVVDVEIVIADMTYYGSETSVAAFETAAVACMCEALSRAHPILIEPIMLVIVLTPDDFIHAVLGDLRSRRAHVQAIETHGTVREITALVPFANMFLYESSLRSATQERASFTMAFDYYGQVQPGVAAIAPASFKGNGQREEQRPRLARRDVRLKVTSAKLR